MRNAESGKIEDEKVGRWACGCWRLEAMEVGIGNAECGKLKVKGMLKVKSHSSTNQPNPNIGV
jgi:hypothetical protein